MDISEVAFKDIKNDNIELDLNDNMEQENINQEPTTKNILEILMTKTGQGGIDDYMENPLNFDNTKETAQILRGLSGYTGDLDLALIDILMGAFRKVNNKKGLTSQNE